MKKAIRDVETLYTDIEHWTMRWFAENGKGCNAIVGISGGKDSTVTAALLAKILGRDRVIGVLLPNGLQGDIEDARAVVKWLGIKSYEFNIEELTGNIHYWFSKSGLNESKQTRINYPARLRMVALYAIAQSTNGRVANTSNLSEDYVGYSTIFGDGAGDFGLLNGLLTDEIIELGEYLEIPQYLLYKIPADGLCGRSDEDAFGFSYATLNDYIRTGICPADSHIEMQIDYMHKKSAFKRRFIPFQYFVPSTRLVERGVPSDWEF